MTHEQNRSAARRVRRLQPDDPRLAGCIAWLGQQGYDQATQEKVVEAVIQTLHACKAHGVEEDEVR